MPRKSSGPRLVLLKKARWTRSIYYIRWTENGRSRECTTGQTNLERAEEVFTDWLIVRGQKTEFNRPCRPAEIAIADVLNDYASDRAEEVEAPERIAYAIDALLGWWHDATVDQIRAETCRRYARERSAATGTVCRELGVLRAATRHAVKEGRLTQTPGF